MSLFEYEREGNADALIEALESANTVEVRRRAADMLGSLGAEGDRHAIVEALVDAAEREDGPVATAAIDSLDELGTDAIEALLERLADVDLEADSADWVKAKAFTEALSADLPELRMAAANALGDVGDPDAVPDLIERFDDPDPRVRARAARACGEIDDARAVEPLTDLLGDRKATVRRAAAESLGRIGNRQALSALLGLYEDEDDRVRRIAVAGFGTFENDRPVDALIEALGDPSAPVRRTAVYSLIELLSNVPTEQSHDIREAVVDQLGAREDGTVVEPLAELLRESTQAAQRRNTAWLLGRVTDDERDREVIDALVETLGDEDEMARQFAATSLASIGGEYVERSLLEIAEDDDADGDARAQAVFALGKVGGDETRRRLESLLEETEDEAVRERTFAALSKLGGSVE
jgi:HEAT repeat protein